MPRYIIKEDFQINGQAGDDFDVTFHVPVIFPLQIGDLIMFSIFEAMSSTPVIEKNTTLITAGQSITLTFNDEETVNLKGKYRWTLRINRSGNKTRIGQGIFNLT